MRRLTAPVTLALLTAALAPAAEPRTGVRLERPAPRLVVSELMYHPAEGMPEFLELQNIGELPVQLSAATFTDGIGYTFAAGRVLMPGDLLVLTDDETTFRLRYPGVPLEGEYDGRLDNGGETLTLSDRAGHPLLRFAWDDRAPWPAVADGEGHTLARCAESGGDQAAWRPSHVYGGTPGAPEEPGCAWRDPTSELFAPDRLLRVEVSLEPSDWEELRNQGRNLFQLLGDECMTGPPASPFTSFPAEVRVDGAPPVTASVRKKGLLGSLSADKPSLKIRFDQPDPGGHLHGLTRMTLNNALQDASFLDQCLTYQLFDRTGVPAPRCSFATVAVNGVELGLYVHVESVDTPFLARRFSSRSGNLYEGTLSDFRSGWLATFERKTNTADTDRSDLDAVAAAAGAPDVDLEAALDAVVDLDAFFTFWALEALVGHWDGYTGNTNNFLVYAEPSDGRFRFVPWGADATFGPRPAPDGATESSPAVLATGALAWRLYGHPPTRQWYVDRLLALLDTVWNETALLGEIDRMEALIGAHAIAERGDAHLQAIAETQDFVAGRRAALRAELLPTPPAEVAPLRDVPCWEELGAVDGTFDTTWDTLGADPFEVGSGTFHLVLGQLDARFAMVGAMAGVDEADPPQATIALLGIAPDLSVWIALVATSPSRVVAGTAIPVDWRQALGILAVLRPGRPEPELVGLIGDGVLQLDEAATGPGAPISGALAGTVYALPF